MNITINRNHVPEFIQSMPNDVYHSPNGAVSSSQLRKILKSPKTFRSFMQNVPHAREDSEALRLGSLIHTAVLEPEVFREQCVIIPEFIGQTKDGRPSKNSGDAKAKRQAWIEEAEAQKKMICSAEEHQIAQNVVNSIHEHKTARKLFRESNGIAESSCFFSDEETGIMNRIRPDFLVPDQGILIDLKTTTNCDWDSFSKTILNYRYDFQMAMYSEGIRRTLGARPKTHMFIVVEKTAPFECAVYIADDAMLAHGHNSYKKALRKLASCLENDAWESYQIEPQVISLPQYVSIDI